MVPIERENDIEIVRSQALWWKSHATALAERIAKLEALVESDKQGWLASSLKDQLSRLETKFFGFGRETLESAEQRDPGHPAQPLLLHGSRTVEKPEESRSVDTATTKKRSVSPLAKTYVLLEKELEEENHLRGVVSDVGAKTWEEMKGLYQESSEVTVTERTYQKIMHRQTKYRLKPEYNKTGKEVIITAPGPAKLKSGSRYSIDFALAVVSDKYEYHLPLERQRRKMEAAGLEVEVKTLYGLCETVAWHCESMREKIRAEILGDFCAAHLDESPWRIIGDEKTGYMWALSNRVGAIYQFEPTRSGKVPKEILKNYRGAILTDAYSGYNTVKTNPEIRVAHCWAHARREFYERFPDFKAECRFAILKIDELFATEAKAKSFGELKELRRTESVRITSELHAWGMEMLVRFLPGDGISKAIKYMLGHWRELTLFLKDLTVPLSNNDAERALRHVVMGRKNFAGSKTINGADTASALYTVIETAKRNSLSPTEYLRYLITERWYGREALSPMEYALSKFKPNSKVEFPQKEQWRILSQEP